MSSKQGSLPINTINMKEQGAAPQDASAGQKSKLNNAKNVIKAVNGRKKLGFEISKIEETFHNEFGKNTLEFDHIIEEC